MTTEKGTDMSAIPDETAEDQWEDYEERDTEEAELPRRPRRQLFNRRSAALLALILGAVCFYAGVRVEKGQVTTSASTPSGFSIPSFLRGGAGSRGGASASGSLAGLGSGGGLPGGAGFGGGNASAGTVSSVDGRTLYIKDASGNTLKVRLSSATKITKSVRVARKAVRPGDSVAIQGLKTKGGALTAASVSDSGTSATTSTSSGSAAGGSASSSSSSAVSSLFGSGG